MKKLLIIYPHWPPSNLAGVHRARLISNFLPEFGWQPVVLTVNPDCYEETADPELCRTVADHVEVHFVDAFPAPRRLRIVGDIGVRAFYQLWRGALRLLRSAEFDFIWIPIPSFYVAVLGRLLHLRTGVPYGIDYIDPWVRPLHPSQRLISRAGLSLLAARILEPIAVRRASLISGVARPYYKPVIDRNFPDGGVVDVAMPYGFDPRDHEIEPEDQSLPWDPQQIRAWVYAGAVLPKSRLFFESLFQSIEFLRNAALWPPDVKLLFFGTGYYFGPGISEIARQHGIDDIVVEQRERAGFLQIQHYLRSADRVLVIGSSEPHYTASKTFQCILSGKPILAMLHKDSTACQFLMASKAATFTVSYDPADSSQKLFEAVTSVLSNCAEPLVEWLPDRTKLNAFSSRESAGILAAALGEALNRSK